jgi:hypothetical protein
MVFVWNNVLKNILVIKIFLANVKKIYTIIIDKTYYKEINEILFFSVL